MNISRLVILQLIQVGENFMFAIFCKSLCLWNKNILIFVESSLYLALLYFFMTSGLWS